MFDFAVHVLLAMLQNFKNCENQNFSPLSVQLQQVSSKLDENILGISLHFSFFAKNEENFKIFAKKAKKLQKNKSDNSNCFYAQIKGFHRKF